MCHERAVVTAQPAVELGFCGGEGPCDMATSDSGRCWVGGTVNLCSQMCALQLRHCFGRRSALLWLCLYQRGNRILSRLRFRLWGHLPARSLCGRGKMGCVMAASSRSIPCRPSAATHDCWRRPARIALRVASRAGPGLSRAPRSARIVRSRSA